MAGLVLLCPGTLAQALLGHGAYHGLVAPATPAAQLRSPAR